MSAPSEPWHRRRWVRLALTGALGLGVVALGPRERFEERWTEPSLDTGWEQRLAVTEAAVPKLRPGDERGVRWVDPNQRVPSPLSLVYVHGFSADRHEVEPLVSRLGDALGANAFYTRLTGHGRDGPAMAEATVERWMDDVAHAFAVGRAIGERVVLVGTSTGGTLALWAASRPEVADALAALVLLSPNFHPKDRTSRVLLWPWGGLMARLVTGPERCFEPENDAQAAHWTTCYPTSALLPMMALTEHVRTMDLATVEAPTLVLYAPGDRVVDAAETERALARLATARGVRYVGSTDPAQHVLAGDVLSPGSTAEVADTLLAFLRAAAVDGAQAR